MNRRAALVIAALLGIGLAVLGAHAAYGALVEVKVGNFYYDDQSVGDGKVEATVGDQLRFVVQDGGPGTPHTVDVDELDIHSGSLPSGSTFTTPALGRAGTFRLYCKPHDRRGHVATLVVYNADGSLPAATTTTAAPAPTTTAAPAPQPTTSPSPTAAPQTTTVSPKASASPITTAANAAPVSAAATTSSTVPSAGSPPDTSAPTGTPDGSLPSDGVTTETVPVGTGEATDEELVDVPVQPDSLEAALGRRPATRGTWTRSVRMALAALAPMLLLAGFAISRARSDGDAEVT